MEATENIVTQIAELIREGDIDQAIESASEFAQSESQDHRAYFTIARLVGGVADPDLTERCLSRSTELWDKEPRYPLALASFLVDQNRHREAIQHLVKSLDNWPDNADAHANAGNCYARTGDLSSAQKHLQQAIEVNEAHGEAHYLLALISDYANRDNPHIVKMKLLTERSDIDKQNAVWIALALGRALERVGDHARAFSYFEKANKLRRPDTKTDNDLEREKIENRIKQFDTAFFDKTADRGFASDVPVFIVGMPGTGATIVEQVIAGHPMASSAGSQMALPKTLSKELAEFVSPDHHMPDLNAVPDGAWEQIGKRYVEMLQRRALDAERVVDARLANFRLLGEARLILPQAKFIHCMRDARDTIMSCYSRPLAVESSLNSDLGVLAETWRRHLWLMDHWKKMIPDNILQINYEAMIANPEDVARQIIGFIGLDWDDACLEFNTGNATAHRASRMRICAPLHNQSVNRWKRFERKMEPIAELLNQ